MRSIVRAPATEAPATTGGVRTLAAAVLSGSSDGPSTATGAPPDDFASKLVKYVPAEVIAFYVPAYALVGKTQMGAILTLVIGVICTFLYLEWRNTAEGQPQPWMFYVLAVVAFIAWALGTSSIGLLIGLTAEWSAFIMLIVVLIIPAIDGLAIKAKAPRMVPTA